MGYCILLGQASLAQASLASVPSSWQRAAAAHFAVGEQDDCLGVDGKLGGLKHKRLAKLASSELMIRDSSQPVLLCESLDGRKSKCLDQPASWLLHW